MSINIDQATKIISNIAQKFYHDNDNRIGNQEKVWSRQEIISKLALYLFHDETGSPELRLEVMNDVFLSKEYFSHETEVFLNIVQGRVQRYMLDEKMTRDILVEVSNNPNCDYVKQSALSTQVQRQSKLGKMIQEKNGLSKSASQGPYRGFIKF